jgi:tol-pal system protein YbgF
MTTGCQTGRPDNSQRLAQISAELEETNQKVEELNHRLSVVQFMVDSHDRLLGGVSSNASKDNKTGDGKDVKPSESKGKVTEEAIPAAHAGSPEKKPASADTSVEENHKETLVSADEKSAEDGAVSGDSSSKSSEPSEEHASTAGDEDSEPGVKKPESSAPDISVDNKSPKAVYDAGFKALMEKDYPRAAALFKVIVRDYPNHDLADNAVYWTGEIFYDQKDYKEAIRIFNRLVEVYPNGGKVPDALLKTGYSYLSLKDKENALKYLKKVVVEYPFTGPGGKAEAMLNKIERNP